MSDIEARIAKALSDKGWRQSDLVTASGITSGGVSNWCRGVVKPEHAKADTLIRLSSALGVRPEWLVYGRGAMSDESTKVRGESQSQAVRLDPSKMLSALKYLERRYAEDRKRFDPFVDVDVLCWAYEAEVAGVDSLGNVVDFGRKLAERMSKRPRHDENGAGTAHK